MANVGDKFIIQVDKKWFDNHGNVLYGMSGFNSLVFDEYGLKLCVPYSKEDVISKATEKELHEEYLRGFKDGGQEAMKMFASFYKH